MGGLQGRLVLSELETDGLALILLLQAFSQILSIGFQGEVVRP